MCTLYLVYVSDPLPHWYTSFSSFIYIQIYTINLLRFAVNITRRCAHSYNRRFIEFEYFVVFFSSDVPTIASTCSSSICSPPV